LSSSALATTPFGEKRQFDVAPRWSSLLIGVVGVVAMILVGVGAGYQPKLGIGLLIAVALALVALLRPVTAALVLVAVVPAVAGLARGLPVPGLRPSEALIGGLAPIILLVRSARTAPPWRALDWLALLYVLATALLGSADLLIRHAPFNMSNLGTLLGPVQFLILYRAVASTLVSSELRAKALRLVLLASVPISILTLLQQFNVGPTRTFLTTITGTDIYSTVSQEGVPRATGPFPHWHQLGGYLMIVLLIGVATLIEKRREVLPTWGLVAVLVPASLALLQTVTASPIIGFLIGSLLLAWWAGHTGKVAVWLAVGAAVLGLAFAPLLGSRVSQQFQTSHQTGSSGAVPQTVGYRYRVWQTEYVPLLSGRLLTGYGPDVPQRLNFPYTESLYVTLLMRGGVPLLLIYGALMCAFVAVGARAGKSDDPDRRIAGRVLVVCVGVLIFIHLLESYFVDSGPPQVLWLLVALMVPVSARAHAGQASVHQSGGGM
jgi:hypothetical protein